MKKRRMKKGKYREDRKELINTNEELVASNRREGKFNRYQRFRMHTWFVAYQKTMKHECEKEGEEFNESFKF